MRRGSRQLLILTLLVPALGGLAVVALRGGASSASTVAPSARPVAIAFGNAYAAFLNHHVAAASLPGANATVRSLAASGGRVPSPYQGKVVLHRVAFSGVLGAHRASALVIAGAGSRVIEAGFSLAYAGGRWQVTNLVPPDFSTLFAPPAPRVQVPPAARAAAAAFAVAYAEYRTGARARPPAGLPAIQGQIAAHHDPLAGAARTRAAARLVRVQLLPQGDTAAVVAVLSTASRRLAFGFILRRSGGAWRAWQFPVSGSPA